MKSLSREKLDEVRERERKCKTCSTFRSPRSFSRIALLKLPLKLLLAKVKSGRRSKESGVEASCVCEEGGESCGKVFAFVMSTHQRGNS
jgi:hypothetical protein